MDAADLDPSAPLCPCGIRGCWQSRFHAALLGPQPRRHWWHRKH